MTKMLHILHLTITSKESSKKK